MIWRINMNRDVFLKKPNEYKRDLDIVNGARKISAEYLQLQTGLPYEECLEFVQRSTQDDGIFPLKSISIKGLKKNKVGDREKAEVSFDNIIKTVAKENYILAPNMVVYQNSEQNMAITSKYVIDKMSRRKVIKRQGLEAFQNKDMDTFALCNNEEYAIKIGINSLSGAHCNPHNPFYNKTAHSTLTSNTRVMVSYSNASTERFVSGNRHYWSKDVVIENILSIVHNTDYVKLNDLVTKYNLYIPTFEDAMEVVDRSIRFYWYNPIDHKEIQDLINTLSDLQRLIFVYNGDFYHFTRFNPKLVRKLIADYLRDPADHQIDNVDDIIKTANSGVVTLATIFQSKNFKGSTLANIKETSPEIYKEYGNTILHIESVTYEYSDLYLTLFANDNLPGSIYAFPHSTRRSVVGSDTDSTMYTVQRFIEWYYGKIIFTPEAINVSNILFYLNNSVIEHILATISKQMGVEDKNLFILKMKNEYMFPIYMRANRAKHYATLLYSREGIVYADPKIEIKGVALKDSKIPRKIMKALEEDFKQIMLKIMDTGSLAIFPVMQKIANLEHEIDVSLKMGDIEYLSSANVLSRAAYKKPDSAAYMHYDLWTNVFEKKYGSIGEPPYRAVKVSVMLNNRTRTEKWVHGLDGETQGAMRQWMETSGRTEFGQFLLPAEIMMNNGIPHDFLSIMNTRKIISELTAGYYILLEICGIYYSNDDISRLVMDEFAYRPIIEHDSIKTIN